MNFLTKFRVAVWTWLPTNQCPICRKKLLSQGYPGMGERFYCEDSCEFEKLKLGHG
jgi:hypothetical protein